MLLSAFHSMVLDRVLNTPATFVPACSTQVDKTEATVFHYEIKPNSSPEAIELCKNCVKRSRTLMLPTVLKYIDGHETPTGIYMVCAPGQSPPPPCGEAPLIEEVCASQGAWGPGPNTR